MSTSASVKITGLEKLQNYLKDYFIRKKNGLLGVVALTTQNIKADAMRNAPQDLGELRGGIIDKIYTTKVSINGSVLSSAPYSVKRMPLSIVI